MTVGWRATPALTCSLSCDLRADGVGSSSSSDSAAASSVAMAVLLAFLPRSSLERFDRRSSSGWGVSRLKYSSSAMPSSSNELLYSGFCCTADEATLDRIIDLLEIRLTGLPDSHEPSESTEASDCDILLPSGNPGLTGESDRALMARPSDPTRMFSGFWVRRRAAMALVPGTSGDATRESGEIGR